MTPLPLPSSAPRGVEVWRLDLDLVGPLREEDWASLSDDEQRRAAKFFKYEDRVRSVATRAALRRLLAERLQRAPAELRFAANRYDKPQLADASGLEFNVSHSGAFALIALSRGGAIGVDIERRDETVDIEGLSALVFSREERALDDRSVEAFFDRWAAKEAVLKALGLGIAEHLQSLSVWRRSRTASEYALRHAHEDWSDARAWELQAPAGYAAALAFVKEGALTARAAR